MTQSSPRPATSPADLERLVEEAFANRALAKEPRHRAAILETVDLLDRGVLRVAEKKAGAWTTHAWVKKAVLLFFPISEMTTHTAGPFEWRDKVPLKHGLEAAGVRAVPGSVVRYSAFVESGAVLMPSLVNVGARVGSDTMIDTWATVGSCAQIGRECHVAGGVGIGGVLEPPAASPVIVEDHVFLGSRCILVEGAVVEEGAVLGANVVVTSTTHVIDVTGPQEVVHKGRIPANSVVIPGTRQRAFGSGTYGIPCALIIGRRNAETDRKTSLNEALREHGVQA